MKAVKLLKADQQMPKVIYHAYEAPPYTNEELAWPEREAVERKRVVAQLDFDLKTLSVPRTTVDMMDILGMNLSLTQLTEPVWEHYDNVYYLFFLAWNYRLPGKEISSMVFGGYTEQNFTVGKALMNIMLDRCKRTAISHGMQNEKDKISNATVADRDTRRQVKIEAIPNFNHCTPRVKSGRYYWHELNSEPQFINTLGPSHTARLAGPSFELINFIHGQPGLHGYQYMYTLNDKTYRFTPWSVTDYKGTDVERHVATDLTNLFYGQRIWDNTFYGWVHWPTWLTKLVVPVYALRGPFGKGIPLLDFIRDYWTKSSGYDYYSITKSDFDRFMKTMRPVQNAVPEATLTFVDHTPMPEWLDDDVAKAKSELDSVAAKMPDKEDPTVADLLAAFEDEDDEI